MQQGSAGDLIDAELRSPGLVTSWPEGADRVAMGRLRAAVTAAWERGWQPADLVAYATRRHGARHRRLLLEAIADEIRAYATLDVRWHEQLAALGVGTRRNGDQPRAWGGSGRTALLACAVDLLRLLGPLPRLAPIGPPPGVAAPAAGGGDVDQRMLGKVRALLAKAESTEFPEEAEALSARAQELMSRHSIDRALLAARSGAGDAPSGRRLAVDSPYEAPKAVLLTVVAEANRCRAVWHRELGLVTVLGFPADLAAVEMLFTSLLVQAMAAMLRAGSRRDAVGRSRTRSFRYAFLNAYAARVGERLREAAGAAVAGAGGKDLLPVLARRDEAVSRAVDSLFPNLVKGRARAVSNGEGWAAGRAAADLASLDGRSAVAGPS
ncbi:DUF2786 domain-containing protein [Actinomadura macrotermitis]|uniref:DUF2786 domain-containing protein n=1 Tax=Actinomadura macrotermitis TaxID=2585200 RepID=A0A7K0BLF1_9ACTN|nr:hypothetical protein [Actinomadura macrotermitis]